MFEEGQGDALVILGREAWSAGITVLFSYRHRRRIRAGWRSGSPDVVYPEEPADIGRYSKIFDHLRATALGPRESIGFINAIAALILAVRDWQAFTTVIRDGKPSPG